MSNLEQVYKKKVNRGKLHHEKIILKDKNEFFARVNQRKATLKKQAAFYTAFSVLFAGAWFLGFYHIVKVDDPINIGTEQFTL